MIFNVRVKGNIIEEHHSHCHHVLSTPFWASQDFSLNSNAIPVIRYSAGIVNWFKSELNNIDCKIGKLLMDCIQEQMSISYTFPGKLVACCGLLNFEQIIAVESETLASSLRTD